MSRQLQSPVERSIRRLSADVAPAGNALGNARRGPRGVRGFTLLEILVVMVIVGVIVAATTLSVGVLGGDQEVEEEARRFWAVLQQAREEAELQGMDIAAYVSSRAYEYLRYDQRRERWLPILGDRLYAPRELPEGLRFRLWIDKREMILKPAPPDRENETEDRKWPPQIAVLSSGEVIPFELYIERDRAEATWRVVGLPDNDLRLERREGPREWVLMAQTLTPEETQDDDRRSSNRR